MVYLFIKPSWPSSSAQTKSGRKLWHGCHILLYVMKKLLNTVAFLEVFYVLHFRTQNMSLVSHTALHNEKLNDLYSSLNIIRVINSRRMGWAGHVARMGRREFYTEFWWENLRERDTWEEPGIDGTLKLRGMFRKWDVGHGLDRAGSG
jgi:hypothetical protein